MDNSTATLEITQENYAEADYMSARFINAGVRNRAYINVLGAELFIKYLADKGIDTENIVSMHSISKILENIDIADVFLPNVHIDVRTVFDEDKIFIPKSHEKYGITPDIYVVLKLSRNFKEAEFLGYFKPTQINKRNQNKDYYFFQKEKLRSADKLISVISGCTESKSVALEPEEILRGRTLSVGYSDNNLSEDEVSEFYKLMIKSSALRDSVAEFDNFEVLSHQVSTVLLERINISESQDKKPVAGIAALTTEEILEEGIKAAVEEKKAEVSEVFEEAETVVEAVENTSEAVAKAEDVFEATEDVVIAEAKENPKHKMAKIEVMQTGEILPVNTEPEQPEEAVQHVQDEQKSQKEELPVQEIGGIQEETAPEVSENDLTINEDDLILDDIEISEELTVDENEPSAAPETDILQTEDIEAAAKEEIGDTAEQEAAGDAFEIVEEDLQPADKEEILTEEDISIEEPESLQEEEILPEGGNITASEQNIPEDENKNEEIMPEAENVQNATDDELTIQEPEIMQGITDDLPELPDDLSVEEPLLEPQASAPVKPDVTIEEITTLKPEITVDSLLDSAIAAIDTGVVANTVTSGKTVSDAAIKMASVAGGLVDDVTKHIIEEQENTVFQNEIDKVQNKHLMSENTINTANRTQTKPDTDGKIYEKPGAGISRNDMSAIHESNSTTDNPESSAFVGGLSDAKIQANMQAEKEGLVTVTDISELQTVEVEKQEDIVHSVVDIDKMETVQQEQIIENDTEIVELDKIESVDSPTRSLGDVEDPFNEMEAVLSQETMELPDLNSYTISEDGTSPSDNTNWGTVDETAKGDLLDLETSGMLFGETSEIAPPENTDNLIDGSMFKSTSMSFDIEEPALDGFAAEVLPAIEEYNQTGLAEDLPEEVSLKPEKENAPAQEDKKIQTLEVGDNGNLNINEEIEISEADLQTEEIDSDTEIPEEDTNTGEANNAGTTAKTEEPEDLSDDDIDNILKDSSAETPEGSTTEYLEDTMPPEVAAAAPTAVEEEVEKQVNTSADSEPDWTEDTGFDSLQDVDIPTGNDFITEPETAGNTPVYKVRSNTTAISSGNFTPGEIPIDINRNATIPVEVPNTPINKLFDDSAAPEADAILNNPGRLSKPAQKSNNGVFIGLGLVGLIIFLGLVFTLGFGISKFIKGQTEETPQPISDTTGSLPSAENAATPAVGDVLEMDNNTNALASTAGTDTSQKTNFVEVKGMSWEAPGSVSANPEFRNYFQSVGKSIKSSLTADLLSVTDMAYASEMRVSVTFNQDGTFTDARIVTSSGSGQIDKIVLRTVNETLNVLKAPHSVGSYENTTAILKINL